MNLLTNWTFYGNPASAWFTALAVLVAGMAVLKVARRVLLKRLTSFSSRTRNGLDDFAVIVLRRTYAFFLFLLALAAASVALALPPALRSAIGTAVGAGVIIQMALWGNDLIGFWTRRLGAAEDGAGGEGTITALAFTGRLVLWAVILLLLLDNFGLQVTTLVTTLGVGGIAVALAAQSVLGDLLAAVSIYLDKPFVIGDFIIFDDILGSVEYVGLRSTRIHSLFGEQIVISNSDLLKTRIHNYKRMFERRVTFQIGVVYSTPADVVARIPAMIRSAVDAQAHTRFDRSHFKGYGESSLDFETVFYVLSPDYNIYMDIQQAINLAIMHQFEEEGIAFAHPVRMVTLGRTAASEARRTANV